MIVPSFLLPFPMPMPAPGDVAPDFEGVTQTGETVRLADFRGRPVAVYFYPQDDTPGCTAQACNLRDRTDALDAAGIAVVGVSPDTAAVADGYVSVTPLHIDLTAHAALDHVRAWTDAPSTRHDA